MLQTSNNTSYANNYSGMENKTNLDYDVTKVINDSFGNGDADEDVDDSPDHLDDPNYVPPDKQYIDILKEYFGHAKFRP